MIWSRLARYLVYYRYMTEKGAFLTEKGVSYYSKTYQNLRNTEIRNVILWTQKLRKKKVKLIYFDSVLCGDSYLIFFFGIDCLFILLFTK